MQPTTDTPSLRDPECISPLFPFTHPPFTKVHGQIVSECAKQLMTIDVKKKLATMKDIMKSYEEQIYQKYMPLVFPQGVRLNPYNFPPNLADDDRAYRPYHYIVQERLLRQYDETMEGILPFDPEELGKFDFRITQKPKYETEGDDWDTERHESPTARSLRSTIRPQFEGPEPRHSEKLMFPLPDDEYYLRHGPDHGFQERPHSQSFSRKKQESEILRDLTNTMSFGNQQRPNTSHDKRANKKSETKPNVTQNLEQKFQFDVQNSHRPVVKPRFKAAFPFGKDFQVEVKDATNYMRSQLRGEFDSVYKNTPQMEYASSLREPPTRDRMGLTGNYEFRPNEEPEMRHTAPTYHEGPSEEINQRGSVQPIRGGSVRGPTIQLRASRNLGETYFDRSAWQPQQQQHQEVVPERNQQTPLRRRSLDVRRPEIPDTTVSTWNRTQLHPLNETMNWQYPARRNMNTTMLPDLVPQRLGAERPQYHHANTVWIRQEPSRLPPKTQSQSRPKSGHRSQSTPNKRNQNLSAEQIVNESIVSPSKKLRLEKLKLLKGE